MITTLKQHLDNLTIHRRLTAQLIVVLIPASCPFARTIRLGRWTIAEIPPLCKLNPFYEELVMLWFRALCFLETEKSLLHQDQIDLAE